VLVALKAHDEAALERAFIQLKTFYSDTRCGGGRVQVGVLKWLGRKLQRPRGRRSHAAAAAAPLTAAAPYRQRCRPITPPPKHPAGSSWGAPPRRP
jgi:hypothetical protein